MAPRIEIGIDSIDPEALAHFWAAALDYTVGDLDPAGVYLDLVPPSREAPPIYLQRVPERKIGKNRLHFDLYDADPESLVERLVALGARALSEVRTGSEGGWWRVLQDPEGNEFCVCREG